LNLKIDGFLKVKRHALVLTGYKTYGSLKVKKRYTLVLSGRGLTLARKEELRKRNKLPLTMSQLTNNDDLGAEIELDEALKTSRSGDKP